MDKRVRGGIIVCTLAAVLGIGYNINASSLCTETEIAGMSAMLDTYYDSFAQNEVAMDPEAVRPDMTGLVVPAGADEESVDEDVEIETGAISQAEITDEVAAVSGEAITTEVVATPEPVSVMANVGISIANEYVNIRKKPNTESKILGKLYRGSAATIVETVGDWVRIKSGSVTGYIKSEYLAIGFDAERLADKYGTKLATVTTTTLKVREERNTDCTVLTLVPEGETFEVVKEYDEWVKILVDDSTKGYVSKEYVDLEVEFKEAISIAEERAIERARKEAERKAREAEEAARRRREEAARQAAANKSNSSSSSSNSSSNKSSSSSSKSYSSSISSYDSSSSGTASDAASYAQNFIGNKYRYGGTSLTNGADCSGFVQSVYSKFGVSLPRTSSSQSSAGDSVSLDNVKAGDLIFYASNGRVNHVAMYIGDGKVVHASNKRDGIKVSNMNYRTPCKARRVSK